MSEDPVADFPGRAFRIKAVSSFNKKDLKRQLSGVTKANIATRNFPLSVTELRKRLKLKDGGDTYIFATTLTDHDTGAAAEFFYGLVRSAEAAS